MRAWVCHRCRRLFSQHSGMCSHCWSVGSLVPVAERDRAQSDYLPEVVGADQLVRASWDEVPHRYPFRIGGKSLVLVSGPEASQKSTLAVRLLDSVPGSVVLVSAEMPPGPQLGELLARNGVKRPSFHCCGQIGVDALHDLVTRVRATVLAFDSAQACGVESGDARHFLTTTDLKVVVVISQLNASGHPYGLRSMRHECDIHLTLEAGVWAIAKSRWQRAGEHGLVLPSEGERDVA